MIALIVAAYRYDYLTHPKNRTMKPVKLVLATIIILSFSAFISIGNQKKPWPVPDAAKKKANPVANTEGSVKEGKALWTTHCKSCHGTKGLGDGPKSAQLKTEAGDFTSNDFHNQTDGSMFYKVVTGRDDMPGYKSKIPDANEIWSLVNYMRSFKKGGAVPKVTPTTSKDTTKAVVKAPEKPVVTNNPPPKKDSVVKKVQEPSLQEQVIKLQKRMDSVERSLDLLKARVDSLHR
jgi:mono/diheme cytochrome c family protein